MATTTFSTRSWTKTFYLPGATSATAGNFGVVFFTAPVACVVRAASERHATAGSDGSAVTVMLKKVPSGTAASAGTDLLAAGISCKATADTNQVPALTGTGINLLLNAGDSLAWVLTGTPTSLAGFFASVELSA